MMEYIQVRDFNMAYAQAGEGISSLVHPWFSV